MSDNPDEKRISHIDFVDNDTRYENSLKFLPIWLEAFMLTALSNAFGPVLNEGGRKRMWEALKVKILEGKSDFNSYQKNKKKIKQA